MRKHYVAFAAAAGLLLTIGAPAEAAGKGGVVPPFAPPGLRSTNPGSLNSNSMKATNITPATTSNQTTGYGPSGWSNGTQGNAHAPDPWKGISSPPGLKK
jgi:hypothetical protein